MKQTKYEKIKACFKNGLAFGIVVYGTIGLIQIINILDHSF